jgi:AcrR family transcriptional regulator
VSAQPGSPSTGSARPAGKRRIRGLNAEQRRAQRREQLLAAAFELFARDGYANAAIEQICQTASVGYKGFYELFDSKEDCYLALLRQVSERIEQRVAQAMQQTADDEGQEETVRRLLSAFAHTLVDDPRVAAVTFGMAAGISPRIEAQRRENRRWTAAFIEGFWRRNHPDRGGTRGDAIDYHALAVATVGGLFEAVTDWLHQPDSPRPRRIDSLVSDLTTFMSVIETGIDTRAG